VINTKTKANFGYFGYRSVLHELPKLMLGNHNNYPNFGSGTLGSGNSGSGNSGMGDRFQVFCPRL
jgi:hypothetical protein